ncbi:MAG: efflux transporter outer membrane subunit [Syntrophobacter sp.]
MTCPFTSTFARNRNPLSARFLLPMLLAAVCLILASCAVGPDYVRPTPTMPPAWKAQADPALVPGVAAIQRWWALFDDPQLTELIAAAVASNLDLKEAVARVDEARARLGVASGQSLPQIDAEGALNHERLSDSGLMPFGTNTHYAPGITASWEIDLFGRIRRSVEAAKASYQASEEDRVDVLTALCAEVARTYIGIRTYQARLAAAASNIDTQRQVLEFTRERFRHGLCPDLNVAQAERVLATSESEVPPLRMELSRSVNTMAVLLGRPPGTLQEDLSTPKPIPIPPEKATVGVPVDLLRQRPDIRRTERQLAAATARIGIATADLYPSLSLKGALGLESIDAGDVFNAGSRVFALGPSLRWNIFDGNRIRNRIKVEDAITRQTLLRYEHSVLKALNEVENSLVAYIEERVRLGALTRSVDSARRAMELAIDLYRQGLVDFQNVLDSMRDLFLLENQLAAARGNSAGNFVLLYKSLGGGWNPDKDFGKPAGREEVNNAETPPGEN